MGKTSIESNIKQLVTTLAAVLITLTIGITLFQDFEKKKAAAESELYRTISSLSILPTLPSELPERAKSYFIIEGSNGTGKETYELQSSDGKIWSLRMDKMRIFSDVIEERKYLLIASVVGLLASVEIATFSAYGLTRHLKRLVWGCQQIASGKWIRIPLSHNVPKELFHVISVFNAIVEEQKRWQKFQKEAQRMERLASLGEVIAGVAHEVKNPLASIRVRLDLLKPSLPPIGMEHWKVIEGELDRLNYIVFQLLSFARPSPPIKTPVSPKEIVQWCTSMMAIELERQSIELVIDCPDGLPSIWCDKAQLQQMLLNLMLNAAQAMPAGGTLIMDAKALRGEIAISISDTGPGIPERHLDRIFDPFFTTKKGGTGLGLSIAHSIVESHGGKIAVTTSDKGTTFTITLPAQG